MRRRLLRSTLAIALVAVVSLGVPLLLVARQEVWSTAADGLQQQAASASAGIEDRIDAHLPIELDRYVAASHGRRIVVVGADGVRTSAGPALKPPLLQASVTVSGSTVTVQEERHPVVVRAREVTLFVLGLQLLAVASAVALALRQARRLTEPLSLLHDRAEALGRGELEPRVIASGIPEIDGISEVLERSARQLGTTIALQREFASDAAHQLRTPLTGIGLRLDELTHIGDQAVRQEAEDALAQVERLDRVISALLARAQGDVAAPTLVDLAALLDQDCATWARALQERGRPLLLDLQAGIWVRVRQEHLSGIISCLLDNALQHGQGSVSVTCFRVGDSCTVAVTDEGPGVPLALQASVFERRVSGGPGTGIGLALAQSLASAEDGRLSLTPASAARFELILPTVDGPTSSP